MPKASQKPDAESEAEATATNEDNGPGTAVVKLTKAEKRAKFKKLRKEAKKQAKDTAQSEEVQQQAPQAQVLVYIYTQPMHHTFLMHLLLYVYLLRTPPLFSHIQPPTSLYINVSIFYDGK